DLGESEQNGDVDDVYEHEPAAPAKYIRHAHVLGDPLEDIDVEPNRRRHQTNLDHAHDKHAKYDRIDAELLDGRQDDRHGQQDHTDAIDEHAQKEVQRHHPDQDHNRRNSPVDDAARK